MATDDLAPFDGLEPPDEDPLEPILALLSSPGERGHLVEAFARAILRRVPAEELEDADLVSTGVALVDAFDFVDGRAPGAIQVRLVDPRVTVDGAHSTGTVVQVNCDDRQFIVTTVKEELHRLGHKVTRMLHPVFGSERSADGRLTAILPARDAEHRESFLQVELGGRVAPEARRPLVGHLLAVLEDVFAATGDFLAMRAEVAAAAARLRSFAALRYPADEVAEGAALLEWLLDDNFVLEGCTRTEGDDVVVSLGIVSETPGRGRSPPPSDRPVRIVRTAEISTVHRQVPMHRVEVVDVGPDGQVVGVVPGAGRVQPEGGGRAVHRHPHAPVQAPPHPGDGGRGRGQLRRGDPRVALPGPAQGGAVRGRRGVPAGGHPGAGRGRADAATSRSCSRWSRPTTPCPPSSPSPRTSTPPPSAVRIERFLMAQLDGIRVDANVSLGEGSDVIARLVVQVDGPLPEPPLHALEREVRMLCRTWDEELAQALADRVGDGRAARLTHAWAEWFPSAYRDAVDPPAAVDDVLQLDVLCSGTPMPAGPTSSSPSPPTPRAPPGPG